MSISPQAARGRARRWWEAEHGPIPPGHHVHHIDGDPYNNDPSNLRLVEATQHLRDHYKEREPKERTCLTCGGTFGSVTYRSNDNFCSNACKSKWRRDNGLDDETRTCAQCGYPFQINRYKRNICCSRACGGKHSAETRRGVPQPKRKGERVATA